MIRIVLLAAMLICAAASDTHAAHGKTSPVVSKNGLVSVTVQNGRLVELVEQIAQAAGLRIYLFDEPDAGPVSLSFESRRPEDVLRSLLRGYSYAVHYGASENGVSIVAGAKSSLPRGKADSAVAARSHASGRMNPATERQTTTLPIQGRREGVIESQTAQDEGDGMQIASQGYFIPTEGGNVNPNGTVAGDLPSGAVIGGGSAAVEAGAGDADAFESQSDQPSLALSSTAASNRHGPDPIARLQSIITGYEQRLSSGVSDRQYQAAVQLSGNPDAVIHDSQRLAFFQKSLARHQNK